MTLEATLTLGGAARRDWDVVVVGAGPAGALAGRLMAQSGLRTLLIERCGFPRRKVCGGCLSHRALGILQQWGLERLAAGLSASPIRSLSVRAFGRELLLPLPPGAVVARAEFDSALVKAAIEAGCEFLPETEAEVGDVNAPRQGYRAVALRQHGRLLATVAARVVVAADGLGARSRGAFGRRQSRVRRSSRVGLNATVQAYPACFRSQRIYLAVGNFGYAGLVRQADGALNVAAAVDPRALGNTHPAHRAVAGILEQAGLPSVPALAVATWKGTGPLTQRPRQPAGERLFLLGDAAGYVEPFTGEGMTMALRSATSVVPLVRRGIGRWSRQLQHEWAAIQRRLAREQMWCRLLASLLRKPVAVRTCLRLFSTYPGLALPIVKRLHGPMKGVRFECP